jgi:hypothetical protein
MHQQGIEQAIFRGPERDGYRCLASSSGFTDAWQTDAIRLCEGFGERPASVECPGSVFARPFGKDHVAIVQVADQGKDEAGRPGLLGFRFLIVARPDYPICQADPFLLADSFPPAWHLRGSLPSLAWPEEGMPSRSVGEIQAILQRPDGPVLLGAVQSLVDGARLCFVRPQSDASLIRSLWMLLPTSNRLQLWPASFAFGNTLGFDAMVVPKVRVAEFAGYLSEQQAEAYPEGRYELNLQIAAEAGDQRGLDALFNRRSSAQTLRLGLFLLFVVALLSGAMTLLGLLSH